MAVDDLETHQTAADLAERYDLAGDVAELLARYGFDPEGFDARRHALAQTGIDLTSNFVTGDLRAPADDDLVALPPTGTAERA